MDGEFAFLETEYYHGVKRSFLVSCEPPHESIEITPGYDLDFNWTGNVLIKAELFVKELFVSSLPRYHNAAMRNFLRKHRL